MGLKFKVLFLILLTQCVFAQNKPLVFRNNIGAYHDYVSDFDNLNELTFSEITINPNSTFSFYSRPYVSCLTWKEVKGKWKKQNELYMFFSQYEIVENDTRFFLKQDSNNRYLFRFKTDKNSELKNRMIKIEYVYDFDDKLDDFEKEFILNQDNSVEILFSEIPNLEKLASIKVDYQLSVNKRRYAYITENKTVNLKESDIPNVIEIEFIEKPKKEIVYRTIKGKIDNGKLEIISSEKTKSKLPDCSQEIGFERYYELEKED